MRRSSFMATIALFIAAVGVIIALAAYFKNRSSYLYDDEDDDFMFDDPDDLEYYSSENTDGDPLGDEPESEYPSDSN